MTIRPPFSYGFQGDRGRMQKIPGTPGAGKAITPSGWDNPVASAVPWAGITSKPTTLSGFGITDGQPLDSDLTAIAALGTTSYGRSILTQSDATAARTYIGAGTSSFSGSFAALSGVPTTIAGYGITDAYTKTATDALIAVKQDTATKGTANGYASLDSGGLIPSAQLPANTLRWTKYTVPYTALSAAALTNDIELFSLPAGSVIHDVILRHTASFTGGLISGFTVSIGVAGNLVKYALAFNTFQAPGAAVFGLGTGRGMESFTAPTSIRVAATSVTGLLNTATAGSVDVWVLTSALP